jgi:ribonuclease J
VIITTGSQGEPMSALSRMAASEHKKVNIIPGDMVIISATPIPGNEKLVSKVINQLFKQGAEVIYEALADVHVSGHACQEELKLIHTLVRPKFFIPVHGEYRHLKQHGELAVKLGMKEKNVYLGENGDINCSCYNR